MTVRTHYRQPELPEYQGNPCEEALPPILSDLQVLELLTNLPPYSEDDRLAPPHVRLHMLDRLLDVFQAQPEHLRLTRTISRLIRLGYKSRNPILPAYANLAYRLATQDFATVKPPAGFAKCRKAAYMTGLSGIGKTSLNERALGVYPQVIVHRRYRGKPFIQTQIPWIKVDCPHDGSLRTFLLSIFLIIDDLVPGNNYFQQYSRIRGGTEVLVPVAARLMHSFLVGLVNVDELNNLTSAPRGGKAKFLNFTLNLTNKVGVPFLYTGTNESAKLFKGRVRNARRLSYGGDIQLERYSVDDPRWRLFLETLWHYQFTKSKVPLDDGMARAMHDASQAITDIAVAIYMCVQENAINRGGEELFDTNDIAKAVPLHISILQPALEVLRRGDKAAYEQFRELLPPADQWWSTLETPEEKVDIDKLVKALEDLRAAQMQTSSAAKKSASGDSSNSTGNDGDAIDGAPSNDGETLDSGDMRTPMPDLDAHALKLKKTGRK